MISAELFTKDAHWCEWKLELLLARRNGRASFRASDRDGRTVFLKLFDYTEEERIEELFARWTSLPELPAIVPCRRLVREQGISALVLDWVDGPTVAAEIRGCPSASRRREIVAAVAEGLATIHRHGYVHGDVSSTNVLCAPGRIALTDLGLGVLDEAGTPPFASDLRGSAADIYALGVLWLLLATGRRSSAKSDLYRLPPDEARLISGCLEGHYASAAEICLGATTK
jgi:serine/threonine protein kinase